MAENDKPFQPKLADAFYEEITGVPLGGVSDRAAAVMSAAYLEYQLRCAIETFFVDDAERRNKFLKPSGPLGALGPKGALGYLLGLYDKKVADEIVTIATIRNNFAHWHDVTHFDHPNILQYVRPMGVAVDMLGLSHMKPDKFTRENSRMWYLSNVLALCGFIEGRRLAREGVTKADLMADLKRDLEELEAKIAADKSP